MPLNCTAGAQEGVRERGGGAVPHEDLRGEQAQGGQAQPALRARPGVLPPRHQQVRGHAAPRVRAHHERVQPHRQVSSALLPRIKIPGPLY